MEKVSEEDLVSLRSAMDKKNTAQNVAKLSVRVVELEHEVAVLRTYIKYGLKFGDTIAEDGTVVRGTESQENVIDQ